MSNYQDNSNQFDKTDHEHIYYNIRIDNPQVVGDNEDTKRCIYNKQTQNIIDRQSDYEIAVESWSVRAKMPIFVCPIVGGTNTVRDLTPYKINYRYFDAAGNFQDFKEDLLWIPDLYLGGGANFPFPKSPSENNGIQDFTTNPLYYNCNSIARFVNMFNNASGRCYDRMVAANPASAATFIERAWLQYDERTHLLSLVFPYGYLIPGNIHRCVLGVDALLYKYIDSIPAVFNGYNLGGLDYTIDLIQKPGSQNAYAPGNHYAGAVVSPQTNPPQYLIMSQENDGLHLWSNIKQILITSSSIAVRDEYMPYVVYGDAIQQREENAFNQSKKSVISYIDYNYASPNTHPLSTTLNRDIFYKPHFYKWIDLVGSTSLNNIQIEFEMVMGDGRTLPLNIPRNASAELKLVFRKKNL